LNESLGQGSLDNARPGVSRVQERWGEGRLSILDAACGIGTQALGLAAMGHRVTGSDLSVAAVERARRQARDRGLSIPFSVADMRHLRNHHRGVQLAWPHRGGTVRPGDRVR